jgi:hypothetical protein
MTRRFPSNGSTRYKLRDELDPLVVAVVVDNRTGRDPQRVRPMYADHQMPISLISGMPLVECLSQSNKQALAQS